MGMPGRKMVNSSSNPAYCGNCKKKIEPEEKRDTNKLTIEDVEKYLKAWSRPRSPNPVKMQ